MPKRNVQTPSSLLAPAVPLHHSRSSGNLPHLHNSRPTSSSQIPAESLHRSQSLNELSEELYAQPVASHSLQARKHSTTPTSTIQAPPPLIMVQFDEDDEQIGRIIREESVDSFESDSFSDDGLSMSGGSSLSLSYGANDEQLRLPRTPPPMAANRLSPSSRPEGTLPPSVSDPNLYKGPRFPKVPPRPQAQEILTRCTSVTRKNATKSSLSPTEMEGGGR